MRKLVSVDLGVAIIAVLAVMWGLSKSIGQEVGTELDPTSPEARATERAARRLERRALQPDPETRETARAERRAEMRDVEQAVELRNPLPLPVEVRNPGMLAVAARPVGGGCPPSSACTLRTAPNPREVVVVTAFWSATRVQCDDLTTASPPNGAAVAPWWRCQRELIVEGPGAGYSGFVITP